MTDTYCIQYNVSEGYEGLAKFQVKSIKGPLMRGNLTKAAFSIECTKTTFRSEKLRYPTTYNIDVEYPKEPTGAMYRQYPHLS